MLPSYIPIALYQPVRRVFPFSVAAAGRLAFAVGFGNAISLAFRDRF
jgi:hypothetical protein